MASSPKSASLSLVLCLRDAGRRLQQCTGFDFEGDHFAFRRSSIRAIGPAASMRTSSVSMRRALDYSIAARHVLERRFQRVDYVGVVSVTPEGARRQAAEKSIETVATSLTSARPTPRCFRKRCHFVTWTMPSSLSVYFVPVVASAPPGHVCGTAHIRHFSFSGASAPAVAHQTSTSGGPSSKPWLRRLLSDSSGA